MKKFKKIIMLTLVLAIAIVPLMSCVYADSTSSGAGSSGVTPTFPTASANTDSPIMGMVNNGWGLVLGICQIAAFAIIIFCGLKYMFSSAGEKADIKKSMVPLLIGAILVFGSTFIVNIVMAIVGSISAS